MIKTEARRVLAQEAAVKTAKVEAHHSVRAGASRLLDRVIFYGLLALVVLAAIPYGAVEPWWEAAFECLVFSLTALWIIEGLISGSWRLGRPHLFIPLLALVLFAFAQSSAWPGVGAVAGVEGGLWTAMSADPYGTQRFAFKLLALISVGALLRSHISGWRRLHMLILVIIGVGVASALFGILRQTTQRGEAFILPYLMPGEGYAQFINRNHFAFLIEMALGLALGMIAGCGVRRDRLLIYVAAAAPLWTALVLSNSRGGIFSSLSQVLFLALLAGKSRIAGGGLRKEDDGAVWRRKSILQSPSPTVSQSQFRNPPSAIRILQSGMARAVLVACLIAAVTAGTLWLGGDPLAGRLGSLPGEVKTKGEGADGGGRRVEVWRATWKLIKANPVTGAGFSAYWVAIPQYHQASGESVPREAHNDYLELLASGGILGGGLAVWFVMELVRSGRRNLRAAGPSGRAACLGALTGLFGVAVHSLVDFGLHITANALIFTALAAIASLDSHVDREASA